MNGKKIACVILMMIVAGIAYGAQIMQKRSKAMIEEATNRGDGRQDCREPVQDRETAVTTLKFKTQDLRQFLKDGSPPSSASRAPRRPTRPFRASCATAASSPSPRKPRCAKTATTRSCPRSCRARSSCRTTMPRP